MLYLLSFLLIVTSTSLFFSKRRKKNKNKNTYEYGDIFHQKAAAGRDGWDDVAHTEQEF